jgi:hypothetical protein
MKNYYPEQVPALLNKSEEVKYSFSRGYIKKITVVKIGVALVLNRI